MKMCYAVLSLLVAVFCAAAVEAADNPATNIINDHYCMTCHGVDGRGNESIQAPRLAGMEFWYLKRQLENFRAGLRGDHTDDDAGLAMRAAAAKLTDESITELVSWVSEWPYQPAEVTLTANVDAGRGLFQSCAACHGEQAQGNAALGAPALAGQNDWYLVTQLKNFQAGLRGSHPQDQYGAQMRQMADTLPGETAILNVVSFINTLGR